MRARRFPEAWRWLMMALMIAGPIWHSAAAVSPFTADAIPVPPAQLKPWSPPRKTTLPPALIKATEVLFACGLADPRELEYRECEVPFEVAPDGEVEAPLHAWVLPVDSQPEQRFAVCWDGVVRPISSVGVAADLRGDVERMLAEDKEATLAEVADYARASGISVEEELTKLPGPLSHFASIWVNPPRAIGALRQMRENRWSALHRAMFPIKAVLLLRCGETDLAERLWPQLFFGETEDKVTADPFASLVTAWLVSTYDRGIYPHMCGKDRLALLSFRALPALRAKVEAAGRKLGFSLTTYAPIPAGQTLMPGLAPLPILQPGPELDLHFLDGVPLLLADQERRAKEPPRKSVAETGLAGVTDPAARVAALIRDLEFAHATSWGSWDRGALCQALIAEGQAAVEPLLHCLETDDRLTREVIVHLHGPGREPEGVCEPAYAALSNILHVTSFDLHLPWERLTSHPPEDRRKLAEALRAYWQKTRKRGP